MLLSSKSAGFTLLEVIVALTLLATIGMATFSWINSSLESLYRVEQHSLKQRGSRTALGLLASINLMENTEGEKQIGVFVISWQGYLVEPVQPGKTSLGTTSYYELALYDVDVRIEVNGRLLTDFMVKQVGYHQVQEFSFGT